jgi:hypothetical protein
VIRREGYDRLHAAMRAAGALRRDVAFDALRRYKARRAGHILT